MAKDMLFCSVYFADLHNLNMDQTAVYYSMHEKQTVNTKGARTVNIRTYKNDSERITVGVTIRQQHWSVSTS